jgi:hypothetical protein
LVPAEVVDPDPCVTSAVLYTELRGHSAGGEDRTPDLGFTKTLHYRCATPAKFTNGRAYPGQKENLRCLKPPFAAPPKETSTGSAGHLMSLQGRPS